MAAGAPAPVSARPLGNARRLYLYVMAFAGLMTLLAALNSLASVVIQELLPSGGAMLGAADTRQRASFYLAALIVGLPVWLGHWIAADRAAGRAAVERQSAARRGFFAAVLAVTALVVLFGLRHVLTFAFTVSLPATVRPTPLAASQAAFRVVLFGAAWFAHWRMAERDRLDTDGHTVDQLRDFALYVVLACSLTLLLGGAIQLLSQAVGELLHLPASQAPTVILNSSGVTPALWGAGSAWLIAGGLMWAALSAHDRQRRKLLRWRTAYLYVVLIIAVPATLAAAIDIGYELLRLGFGYRPGADTWDFLRTSLPLLLTGSATWMYHWKLVRDQSGFSEPDPGVVFAWPRRPGIALLALLGLFTAAPAFGSLLWVGFDWAFQSSSTLSGQTWWRDRTSVSLAAAVIGGGTWLWAWLLMQRAAAISAAVELYATARRVAVATVVIVGAVVALGFSIAALWLIIQVALGEPFTPTRQSLLVKELSSLLIAAGIALYYAQALRAGGGGLRRGSPKTRRLVALLTPGSDPILAEIRRTPGIHIQLIGQLASAPPAELDLSGLRQRLESLGDDGQPNHALVILHPDGGSFYPMTE